jgi:hypothetical protein
MRDEPAVVRDVPSTSWQDAGMPDKDAQTDSTQLPIASWAMEAVSFEALGVDPKDPQPTELMNICRVILATVALRPAEVVFVVTGDFVESVRSRLPEEVRHRFDMDRGAGTLAAKTMHLNDAVHVLFDDWLFHDLDYARQVLPEDEAAEFAGTAPAREKAVMRTATHEAQHVAMYQAGEDSADFAGLQWARATLLGPAHQVELVRITSRYRRHGDIVGLMYSVVEQATHAWKALAYLAAFRRVSGVPVGEALPAEVTDTRTWTRMVQPHWDRFEQILSTAPPGGTRLTPGELEDTIGELADLLASWLQTFGFVFRDNTDSSEFLIEDWMARLA